MLAQESKEKVDATPISLLEGPGKVLFKKVTIGGSLSAPVEPVSMYFCPSIGRSSNLVLQCIRLIVRHRNYAVRYYSVCSLSYNNNESEDIKRKARRNLNHCTKLQVLAPCLSLRWSAGPVVGTLPPTTNPAPMRRRRSIIYANRITRDGWRFENLRCSIVMVKRKPCP